MIQLEMLFWFTVPAVRFALRHHTLAQCQAMAAAALEASDPAQARDAVVTLLDPAVRDLLV